MNLFFYRRSELTKRLGISASTLDRWVVEGRFPAPTKINRVCLWRQEDVARWFERQQEAKT